MSATETVAWIAVAGSVLGGTVAGLVSYSTTSRAAKIALVADREARTHDREEARRGERRAAYADFLRDAAAFTVGTTMAALGIPDEDGQEPNLPKLLQALVHSSVIAEVTTTDATVAEAVRKYVGLAITTYTQRNRADVAEPTAEATKAVEDAENTALGKAMKELRVLIRADLDRQSAQLG